MRAILFFSLCISFAGCASSYKPDGFGGGFSETQLDTNIFRISFRGNGYTRPERAEELALLRSAELSLKNGFAYFGVIDSRSHTKRGTFTTPTQSYTSANATAYGNSAYGSAITTTSGGQIIVISKPSTTNTIMCFKEKPDIEGLIYDAKFLCGSLGAKYGVTCGTN